MSAGISRSGPSSMRVRIKRNPVPASAGCKVKRHRQAGMNADTAQRGVVAKRRLPSDFHTPVPLIPPAARINGTRRIRRATSVAFLPSVRLYIPAGKVSAALSPDKNPFAAGSLAAVRRNANSRFFTDCYHQAAAIKPADVAKPDAGDSAGVPGAAATGAAAAQRSRYRRERTSARLSIWLSAQSLKGVPPASGRPGRGPGDLRRDRQRAADGAQFACRRRNAGMSS